MRYRFMNVIAVSSCLSIQSLLKKCPWAGDTTRPRGTASELLGSYLPVGCRNGVMYLKGPQWV